MPSEIQVNGVQRVRVEVTTEDDTYEIELEGPLAVANLGLEMDVVEVPSSGPWVEREATGCAEVTLRAHGKLVKSERRKP